jgi:hypothetical protein
MKSASLATLLGGLLSSPAFAEAAEPVSSTTLDPFGLALLGAGLSGLALSRVLRRRR